MSQLLRHDGPVLYNELELEGNDKSSSMATNISRSSDQQPHRKFDQHTDRDFLLESLTEPHKLLAKLVVNKIGYSNQNTAAVKRQARRQGLNEELSKIFAKMNKWLGHVSVLILPKPTLTRSGSPVEWLVLVEIVQDNI